MPIYDYRCDVCGHAFTALQAWADAPLETCPECGARPRRLISLPAIHFKGSGWHVTDYGRKGDSKESEPKGGEGTKKESEPKGGGGTKAEKGASKADAAAAE